MFVVHTPVLASNSAGQSSSGVLAVERSFQMTVCLLAIVAVGPGLLVARCARWPSIVQAMNILRAPNSAMAARVAARVGGFAKFGNTAVGLPGKCSLGWW